MKLNTSQNSLRYWDRVHATYQRDTIKVDNWLDQFASLISSCTTPILDLGCGSGNDTLYLINRNKQVIACDQSPNAIANIRKNFPEIHDAKCFNMLDGLPFADNTFALVIADLCLHYFRTNETFALLREINRILVKQGHLILRVNSINDVNHGAGQGREIEPHLYETADKRLKRFFDAVDIKYFFQDFTIKSLHEKTMTRYELPKQVYQVCVQKKSD